MDLLQDQSETQALILILWLPLGPLSSGLNSLLLGGRREKKEFGELLGKFLWAGWKWHIAPLLAFFWLEPGHIAIFTARKTGKFSLPVCSRGRGNSFVEI